MEMQEEQLSRGDLGLHEHPDLATSWELPKVQQFLSHEEVLLIKSHLCRFGLIINGKLSRKSTLFATTCDAIAAKFAATLQLRGWASAAHQWSSASSSDLPTCVGQSNC